MTALSAAAATDVGRVREANEDSFLQGDSVFAVADGMGGHLAGEVASATALRPVAELDGRVFPDAESAATALRDAVIAANTAVAEKAAGEPTYRGMGTTLTAAMIEGRRMHFAHVGDSRAYLLRSGEFSQLTDDHTLVQHLIDEGQITREEAARHPQRSIITRAIGVSSDVEVDSMSLDLDEGDQVLLCSDGLSGVVDDDAIATELSREAPLGETVQHLVALANENGGPDNITVLLLRYGTPPTRDASAGEQAVPAAAVEGSRQVIRTRDGAGGSDWASRIGRLGGSQGDDESSRRAASARTQRIGAIAASVVVILLLAFFGGRWLLSRSYFVGLRQDRVTIFQGIPAEVGPFELYWPYEETTLTSQDVPEFYRNNLQEGITAADLGDARRIVAHAPRTAPASPSPAPTPTRTPAPSPTSAPSATSSPA